MIAHSLFAAAALLLSSTAGAETLPTRLSEVAQLDQAPGNITVTPDGRVIISLHQFFSPDWRVAEVLDDGSLKPFPDEQWSAADGGPHAFDAVLGIQSDSRGVVWMLDNGLRNDSLPKLVGWDTRQDRLARILYLPSPVTPNNAFVNDLAVDEIHGAIYIADPAGGNNAALIVVDLQTGLARRLLQGHRSVVPEEVTLTIDGHTPRIKKMDGELITPRIGVNPIALDAKAQWLYFGPMHGTSLYRIEVRHLLDTRLDAEALGAEVERYSDKPISDGISIDRAGAIYVTDLANDAVGVIKPDRSYGILVSHPYLSWPDAFSFGPDNGLYTVSNQLHRSARLNQGRDAAEPPFRVLRVLPMGPGIPGR